MARILAGNHRGPHISEGLPDTLAGFDVVDFVKCDRRFFVDLTQ
jgi:hypothetical protein